MTTIRISMTRQSEDVIARHAKRSGKIVDALSRHLAQGLGEMESHIKLNKLSGTYSPGGKRGGSTPVATRSGSLRQAVTSRIDQPPLSGFVGVTRGPASKYAAVILGDRTWTIRPTRRAHLWIPVGDNLTASGSMRISPTDAMARKGPKGGRLLSIFTSKRGNLVAVLMDKVPGVRRKGGKLLFVLKKSVEVQGTDALAEGIGEKTDRLRDLLEKGLREALA